MVASGHVLLWRARRPGHPETAASSTYCQEKSGWESQLRCLQVGDAEIAALAAARCEVTAPEWIALSRDGCPRLHYQRCGERESFAVCPRVQRAKQRCPGAASRTSRRRLTSSFPQAPVTAVGSSDFYTALDRGQRSHRMVRSRAAILPLALLHFCVMAAGVAANSMEPSALDLQWTPLDTPAGQVFLTQPQVRWPQRKSLRPQPAGRSFGLFLEGTLLFDA